MHFFLAKTGSTVVGDKLADLFPILKTSTQNAGSTLNDGNGNQFFYNGIAFIVIFIIVLFLCRWITRRFNLITKLPVIHQLNAILGGLINFGLTYITIFFLINYFSSLAKHMVASTNYHFWIGIVDYQ